MPAGETRALFDAARQGSPGAVDAFYERCARKLLPIIRLRLGRQLRAEVESRDILQTVLCRSFERLNQVLQQSAAATGGQRADGSTPTPPEPQPQPKADGDGAGD